MNGSYTGTAGGLARLGVIVVVGSWSVATVHCDLHTEHSVQTAAARIVVEGFQTASADSELVEAVERKMSWVVIEDAVTAAAVPLLLDNRWSPVKSLSIVDYTQYCSWSWPVVDIQ